MNDSLTFKLIIANDDTHPTDTEPSNSKGVLDNKYSYASIKPNETNRMSALSRIKAIQENDWKTWKGVNVKRTGRPGTSGLIKLKYKSEVKDDPRFK